MIYYLKRSIKAFIIFSIIMLYANITHAQNRIQGRVISEVTGEPIPYASVFFANTTFGSSTDLNGRFVFSNFPPGKYDLSVSYVGYKAYKRALEFSQNQTIEFDIILSEEVTELYAITVKPDTANWQRNYQSFKLHFLGTSRFAEKALIQNPEDIHLYYDASTSVLVAHARKPIIIDNPLTGYRIYYYLDRFEYNGKAGFIEIFGVPQFELLKAKNNAEQRKWKRNRQDIYEGSLIHFTRSWLAQNWIEEGFSVARMYRIPNKERPSEAFLSAKINQLRSTLLHDESGLNMKIKNSLRDSLSYYISLRSKPVVIDSVLNEKLTGAEFTAAAAQEIKDFSGLLQVRYRKNEDQRYAAIVGRAGKVLKQKSIVQVRAPLKLYSNGYYEDVQSVFLEQYWS
ncbi:MAG TPA: carboxypeptidase-like regulatory domain-containing protein, partial [Cyclobacteriaceae bacterium]|nr:carboxypeptidase-like regulatory domain-containing protein [Cyclobacteriaceae bacterium]